MALHKNRLGFGRGSVALLLLGVLLGGCAAVGPTTIARDRVDYLQSISESWKRQVLLNLVKLRYSEAPVFLDVASIISSYELYGEMSAQAQAAPQNRAGDSFLGIGAGGRFTDRPTITYSPLQGDKFARSLMTPLPVSGILLLIQGGYPVDVVLQVSVNTINGLPNATGGLFERAGAPQFFELSRLLREAQRDGDLGFETRALAGRQNLTMSFRAPDAVSRKRIERIATLLGSRPDAREFSVSYGSFPESDRDIALQTRSMLQMLSNLAATVEVPAQDVAEGRAYAIHREGDRGSEAPRRLTVRNGPEAPADAYVAVRYRDRYFWIDDRDSGSKAMLSFVMLMFSLTESGASAPAAPLITVPTR
ncbi:hypothetical protein [Roseateles violae]|uniref:Beta-barrel assembly machine subunit BamC n=1 Tax=Roseateles violae TaxID=3058042 RepID=A0ABT8DVN0_9BURK|nr:hypothetical protein [Pelomonas sp. PFR6]MDN3920206.1 hypothetical protein [Pelomonas sp. PFR6]